MPKIIKRGEEKIKAVFFKVDRKMKKRIDAVSMDLIGEIHYRMVIQRLVNDYYERKKLK